MDWSKVKRIKAIEDKYPEGSEIFLEYDNLVWLTLRRVENLEFKSVWRVNDYAEGRSADFEGYNEAKALFDKVVGDYMYDGKIVYIYEGTMDSDDNRVLGCDYECD